MSIKDDIVANYEYSRVLMEKYTFVWDFLHYMGIQEVIKSCNCYIAGGYARMVANIIASDVDFDTAKKIHDNYVSCDDNRSVRDVDIFFFSNQDFDIADQLLNKKVESKFFSHRQTIYAKTYKFFGNIKVYSDTDVLSTNGFKVNLRHNREFRVQLITCNYGHPEEVISGFDFLNAMVGFDTHRFYIHRRFFDLEKDKTIELNFERSLNSLIGYRLNKYRVKGLKKLTAASEKRLQDFLLELSKDKDIHTRYDSSLDSTLPSNQIGLDSEMTLSKYNVLNHLILGLPHELRLIVIARLIMEHMGTKEDDYRWVASQKAMHDILSTIKND